METWSQYSSYAFSTTGSGYALEGSALYVWDRTISWRSYSIMGVSCLQQHVRTVPDCTHGPVSGLTAATLRPCQRPFYSFFQPHHRTFYWRILQSAGKSKPARSVKCLKCARGAEREKDGGTHWSGGPAAGWSGLWVGSGFSDSGVLLLFGG